MPQTKTRKKRAESGPELVQIGPRVEKKRHPAMIRKLAKHFKTSDSGAVRIAIDELHKRTFGL